MPRPCLNKKTMSFKKKINKLIGSAAVVAAAMGLGACDQVLDNGYGECTVNYYIDFVYDYNVMEVDAFAKQVESVAVYAFDKDGKLAHVKTDSGKHLAEDGYKLHVGTSELDAAHPSTGFNPADYQIVAWCGMAGEPTFTLPETTIGVTTIEELKCKMNRSATNEVGELTPLFHGLASYPAVENPNDHLNPTATIPLVKNTNTIRIVMQNQGGEELTADLFDFKITDSNGLMAYDNQILTDDDLTYRPFFTTHGSVDMAEAKQYGTRASSDNANVVIAEFSFGRLMEHKEPRLTVTIKSSGRTVFSIPLVDYALLVKSNYKSRWGNQEYLDRQDEYNMTFFLDNNLRWMSAYIYINSYRVVLNDTDLKG